MARKKIESLLLYPEERECRAPSAERILELFSVLFRHRLRKADRLVEIFEPEISKLQRKILGLLRMRPEIFVDRK
jgi:hypothetical protein